MFNQDQQNRLYNASALGGGEINPKGSHAAQWTNLSAKDIKKIARRSLQVQFELVNEAPHLFSIQGVLDVKNEMRKAIKVEEKKGLKFDYKTKQLQSIFRNLKEI